MLRAIKRVIGSARAPARKVPVTVDAPPDKHFWVNGGPVLKNIKDLRDALKTMTDGQYSYHTVPRGNDFARWVRDVLRQELTAKKLEKVKTRREALKIFE
jgi:hypothetical protein